MSTGDIDCVQEDARVENEKVVDKDAAGLIDVYKEASEFKGILTIAFIIAGLRGLEMPISSIAWGVVSRAINWNWLLSRFWTPSNCSQTIQKG